MLSASLRRTLCLAVLATTFTSALHFRDDEPVIPERKDQISQVDYQRFAEQAAPINHVDPFRSVFADHFSQNVSDNSIFFYNHFKALVKQQDPDAAFVVTSSPAFSLLAYANDPANKDDIRLRFRNPEDVVSLATFVGASRRRAHDESVAVDIRFASLDVMWRGKAFGSTQVTWVEPFSPPVTQHHIVCHDCGDNGEAIIRELIREVSAYNSKIDHGILVFDQSRWQVDRELWKAVSHSTWDDVILDSDLKDKLRHEYRSFYKSEQTYKELGVPWKRGIIYLGPPGNGKTVSLRATMAEAEALGVTLLYVKTFKTYAGDEYGIKLIFERARREAPSLLVLEDLDSLITDNNRAFFLNEVDGIEDNDGLLMIGTTNHFDKLDTAISSRPSRFDRKYVFPNPTFDERVLYAAYWQKKLAGKELAFPESLKKEFAERTDGLSFSYLKEAFVSTLILIATDETKSMVFRDVLFAQIKALKKELESGKGDEKQRETAGDGQQPFSIE